MVELKAAGRITAADLSGTVARRRKERAIRGVFFSAAFLSILITVAIVISVVGGAADFINRVELGSLWSSGWLPRKGQFDVKTILVGTALVSGIAMLVAAPLGLGAALYLSEYARPRARRALKPILETLASVPSVVMGFFALRFINPQLVQRFFDSAEFFNFTAAGIGVGLLVTPLVASVAEDAMHAVPASLREASFGLGARRRATSLRVVVPAAVSGVTAAVILGISRAIGETMVVAIAAGGTGGAPFTWNPLEGGQAMTGAITSLATGSDQVRGSGPAYPSLFFVALLLFASTLALNLASEGFVRRIRSAQ